MGTLKHEVTRRRVGYREGDYSDVTLLYHGDTEVGCMIAYHGDRFSKDSRGNIRKEQVLNEVSLKMFGKHLDRKFASESAAVEEANRLLNDFLQN